MAQPPLDTTKKVVVADQATGASHSMEQPKEKEEATILSSLNTSQIEQTAEDQKIHKTEGLSGFQKARAACAEKWGAMSKKQKAAVITTVAVVILAALGTLAIWQTVGFDKAGDWIRTNGTTAGLAIRDFFVGAYAKAVTWLNAGSTLTNGQSLLYIGVPSLVAGGLTFFAIRQAACACKHRWEERKKNKASEDVASTSIPLESMQPASSSYFSKLFSKKK